MTQPSSASPLRRLWRQHVLSCDGVPKSETDPRMVLLVCGTFWSVVLAMRLVPAAHRFSGLDHVEPVLALSGLAAAAGLLNWRHYTRRSLRSVLHLVDTGLYCAAAVLVMLDTVSPVRYVFGLVFGQMATDYGRRYRFSVPFLFAVSLLPFALSLFAWPDFGIIALVLFGAMMFPYTAFLTDRKRRLQSQNAQLRSAFESADRVASHSLDIALATTVAEMGGYLHHLRNALTPVVSGLHFVRDSSRLDAEERDALAAAERNLDKSCDLLDKLIGTVKGRATLPTTYFPLVEVLQRAVDRVREVKGVPAAIAVSTPHPGVEVRGNPDHLQLAVENLLSNALEAGAQRVTLSTLRGDGGRLATLSIADDGPGLPSESLGSLFVAPVAQGRQGGHGFGLYISRRLVELFGGTVRLETSGPSGATFAISLPVRERPQRSAPASGGPA